MIQFELCPEPASNRLMENDAVRFTQDQQLTLPFFTQIVMGMGYWIKEADWAEQEFSGGRYDLAMDMAAGLGRVAEDIKAVSEGRFNAHSVRKGLAFLAMTRLCQLVVPRDPQISEQDGLALGTSNVTPELLRDEDGNLERFSLHLDRENVGVYFLGGVPTVKMEDWQRTEQRDMVVHRTFPSQPGDRLLAALEERRVEVDFANMCMLTPHFVWVTPPGK